jgi:hypothetical protein
VSRPSTPVVREEQPAAASFAPVPLVALYEVHNYARTPSVMKLPPSFRTVNTEVRLVRCGLRQRRFESADGGDAALACVEQLVPVLGRPSARGGQRLQRAAAQRCQRVLHPQFGVGVHRA